MKVLINRDEYTQLAWDLQEKFSELCPLLKIQVSKIWTGGDLDPFDRFFCSATTMVNGVQFSTKETVLTHRVIVKNIALVWSIRPDTVEHFVRKFLNGLSKAIFYWRSEQGDKCKKS